MINQEITIVECPRDAIQGIENFIPTEKKISYYTELLKCGFQTLDIGSFVNPKAVPQLSDTEEILNSLAPIKGGNKFLVIVANSRGAQKASEFAAVDYIGFPLSISETFQQRNTNKSISEAISELDEIRNIASIRSKELVVYLSMAFGNPYGDHYTTELVVEYVNQMSVAGIKTISLADTTGLANINDIKWLYSELIPAFPKITFGAHFHADPNDWIEKIEIAYQSGCRRFDSAILGYGGCPFAKNELVGNIPTEFMVQHFQKLGFAKQILISNKLIQLAEETYNF